MAGSSRARAEVLRSAAKCLNDAGVVHSEEGSLFSSTDWQSFLKANHLVGSMGRRGNCHDNFR